MSDKRPLGNLCVRCQADDVFEQAAAHLCEER